MRKIAVLVCLALLSACGVNSVPTSEEAAKARWANVQSLYQRRADLLPNLVETVKASSRQEKEVLVGIAEARSGVARATLTADELSDPAKVRAFERAQGAVTLSLQRLQEAYPDLKSQGNYSRLMDEMAGTENRINVARKAYNDAVQEYNTRIRTFPDAIGAKVIHGAKPLVPFQATTPGAETAPRANFG